MQQRQAARGVAGPAPPPSWRSTASSTTPHSTPSRPSSSTTVRQVTTKDLEHASELFGALALGLQARLGASSLVDETLRAILAHLNTDEVIEVEVEDGTVVSIQLADLMRDHLPQLDTHLKARLLQLSSVLPEGATSRLSDKATKLLLHTSSELTRDIDIPDHEAELDLDDPLWDSHSFPTLHHLPLTLHPSPHALLRQLPVFSAVTLTSLNLAYSTLHPDLERLVTVLPSSLRELGLAGVRVKGSMSVEGWRRGLGILGRKLIVLRVSWRRKNLGSYV